MKARNNRLALIRELTQPTRGSADSHGNRAQSSPCYGSFWQAGHRGARTAADSDRLFAAQRPSCFRRC